jgi:hypothetical protein
MTRAWSMHPDRRTPSGTAGAEHPWQVMALSAAPGPLASCRAPANPAIAAGATTARAPHAGPVRCRALSAAEACAFPEQIDPTNRYLSCLQDKAVADQGLPAVRAEFEEHRSKGTPEMLCGHGFVVISELRRRGAAPAVFAPPPAGQTEDLLAAGVRPGSVTVVGAGRGAAHAALASCRPADSGLRSVLPSSCRSDLLQEWATQGSTIDRPTNR